MYIPIENEGDIDPDLATVPTLEMSDDLQNLFDQFNWQLFGRCLKNAMVVLQRKPRSYGYFSPQRYNELTGKTSDEIALNPVYINTRPLLDTLATLVACMVCMQQYTYGKPSRSGYKNREWAQMMKAVGLVPSSTGAPGGKETGYSVSYYIDPQGKFAGVAQKLIERGLKIRWGDIPAGGSADGPAGRSGASNPKSGKRVKYVCPECGRNAQSSHDASFLCDKGHSPKRMAP
jgi:predicted SprT family Zn-dependent metalloprotease